MGVVRNRAVWRCVWIPAPVGTAVVASASRRPRPRWALLGPVSNACPLGVRGTLASRARVPDARVERASLVRWPVRRASSLVALPVACIFVVCVCVYCVGGRSRVAEGNPGLGGGGNLHGPGTVAGLGNRSSSGTSLGKRRRRARCGRRVESWLGENVALDGPVVLFVLRGAWRFSHGVQGKTRMI